MSAVFESDFPFETGYRSMQYNNSQFWLRTALLTSSSAVGAAQGTRKAMLPSFHLRKDCAPSLPSLLLHIYQSEPLSVHRIPPSDRRRRR